MNSARSAGWKFAARVAGAGPLRRISLAAIGVWAVLAGPGHSQEPAEGPPVVRVEEDWELQVGAPDTDQDAPQIVNVISPVAGINGPHAVFELNHRTMPLYIAGGMQLQTWVSEHLVDARNFPRTDKLTTPDELVRYTLAMSATEGLLKFEVINGTSTAWGPFGGQGYLKSTIDAGQASLQDYDPGVSAKHSRIGFASHRVRKFALKEVRYYSADGSLLRTDDTERVVHVHTAGN
ncbi:MAG: hypothetical protein WD069_10505 [Planctomycetales bacterium]